MPRPIDIDAYLSALEYEYEIAILGAWDTGSRAWGLAHSASDYDIALTYVRPPSTTIDRADHTIDTNGANLSHVDPRSEISPDLVELAGWEAGYFLDKLRESNPSILEALHSPIVYRTHPCLVEMRDHTSTRFNIIDLANHYRRLAEQNYTKYITGNRPDEQTVSRTLNIIRALMYAEAVYETHALPPMEFPTFVASAPERLWDSWDRNEVRDLIEQKTDGEGGAHIGNPYHETIEGRIDALRPEAISPQKHTRDEYLSDETLRRLMKDTIQSRLLTK